MICPSLYETNCGVKKVAELHVKFSYFLNLYLDYVIIPTLKLHKTYLVYISK